MTLFDSEAKRSGRGADDDDSGSCKLSDGDEDSQSYLKGDSKKITKNEKR